MAHYIHKTVPIMHFWGHISSKIVFMGVIRLIRSDKIVFCSAWSYSISCIIKRNHWNVIDNYHTEAANWNLHLQTKEQIEINRPNDLQQSAFVPIWDEALINLVDKTNQFISRVNIIVIFTRQESNQLFIVLVFESHSHFTRNENRFLAQNVRSFQLQPIV